MMRITAFNSSVLIQTSTSKHCVWRRLSFRTRSRVPTSSPFILSVAAIQPTAEAPSPWLSLAVVAGLPVALWAYKCLMMVVFQRKIIYMGYVPPGARTEELETLPPGIRCDAVTIASEPGVTLTGIVASRENDVEPQTIMIYLQGNAGNPLHRIPVFHRLITAWPSHTRLRSDGKGSESENAQSSPSSRDPHLAVVAVAPRSYWKSSNRPPTERGILTDYLHVVHHVLRTYPTARIILYGHSLGGAAAACLLSKISDDRGGAATTRFIANNDERAYDYSRIKGIVLENPFASIPGMVRALYPQRWLPYHYLAPLAFDKWDAVNAMRNPPSGSVLSRLRDDAMLLVSEKDELVPRAMGEELLSGAHGVDMGAAGQGKMNRLSGGMRMVVVQGALHENAWQKRQWVEEMKRYIEGSRAL